MTDDDFGTRYDPGPVVLNNITCTAKDSNISQCLHSLSIGVQNCTGGLTVGIKCTPLVTVKTTKHFVTSTSAPIATRNTESSISATNAVSLTSVIAGTVGALIFVVVTGVAISVLIKVVVTVAVRRKRMRQCHTKKTTNDR